MIIRINKQLYYLEWKKILCPGAVSHLVGQCWRKHWPASAVWSKMYFVALVDQEILHHILVLCGIIEIIGEFEIFEFNGFKKKCITNLWNPELSKSIVSLGFSWPKPPPIDEKMVKISIRYSKCIWICWKQRHFRLFITPVICHTRAQLLKSAVLSY